MRRKQAFTLIELLVVIAIIAILAAILFPVFARAREKARQTSCLSNLKQLSLGLRMYIQDYDERFPTYRWGEGRNNNPNSCTWWGGIYPYVKNTQIYACPSSPRQGTHTWSVWINANPNFNNSTSINYGYSEIIGNTSGGLRESRLHHVAETVVLADCTSSWIGGYWAAPWPQRALLRRVAYAGSGVQCGCPPPDTHNDDWALHNSGSNVGFADGHAKWFKSTNCKTVTGGGPFRYYSNEW